MHTSHIGSSLDDFLKEEGLYESCKVDVLKKIAREDNDCLPSVYTKKNEEDHSIVIE